MKTKKLLELLGILVCFGLTAIFVLYIKANYLTAVLLYCGIPCIYLSIRKPALIKKSALYSLLMGIPSVFIFDYMAHVSGAWYEASEIGIRVLDSFPIDAIVWSFLYGYFIVIFYEYFFDKDRKKTVFSKNTKYLFSVLLLLSTLFSVIYFLNKEILIIKYFYIIFVCLFFITPSSIILFKFPHLFEKIALQEINFFILSIIYELTAIHLSNWYFGGKYYIGFVELFGIRFPFEEFLWLVLAVPAYLCIYEFFADDRK